MLSRSRGEIVQTLQLLRGLCGLSAEGEAVGAVVRNDSVFSRLPAGELEGRARSLQVPPSPHPRLAPAPPADRRASRVSASWLSRGIGSDRWLCQSDRALQHGLRRWIAWCGAVAVTILLHPLPTPAPTAAPGRMHCPRSRACKGRAGRGGEAGEGGSGAGQAMACLSDQQLARVVGEVSSLLTLGDSVLRPRLDWLRGCGRGAPTPRMCRRRSPCPVLAGGVVILKEQVDSGEPVQCSQDNAPCKMLYQASGRGCRIPETLKQAGLAMRRGGGNCCRHGAGRDSQLAGLVVMKPRTLTMNVEALDARFQTLLGELFRIAKPSGLSYCAHSVSNLSGLRSRE